MSSMAKRSSSGKGLDFDPPSSGIRFSWFLLIETFA